ncbi:glucose 1-dehydrogenase [Prauserella flavalba]|uniref:Short chain dehydrogenase n=1 Tax=Prauserella flavalba TaxID=1477506 RepID=A0A318LW60_9PSEU|nr:glucose 1-dehydrogenase [Prauserella flavalba]PXY36717.1 short chain dehydrogenase [Prauserella flavalba]
MKPDFSLTGRQALVTGSGQGIGEAIALAFAEAGADVACVDKDGALAERTAEAVTRHGRRAIAIAADVTDADAVEAAVQRTVAELGGLSVACNNAGIAIGDVPSERLDPGHWRRVVDVNLTGVFLCAQAEARVMLAQGGGAILNTASMSATIANRGLLQANYNASKAGVAHLTKSLAVEWADRGVRVNAISPGYTLTPLTARPEVAELREAWARDIPLGRMATVDDLMGPAVFLCSDAARYCTGVDLLVDGGFTCW